MDGADVEDESEPDQSIWEPEMQHVVDTDNVELPKPTVSNCLFKNFLNNNVQFCLLCGYGYNKYFLIYHL